MNKITINEVDHSPHPRGVVSVRRLVGEELSTEALDITYYEIDVDGQFAGAYHRHLDREEVFIILSGIATFETESGTIAVESGQAIHFEPGDWQLGYNDGAEPVCALLVATPKELEPVEAYLHCPSCDEETRFAVKPDAQTSGETLKEARVCEQCDETFDMDS